MIALLLVAGSLGLDNFAASIAIGMSGVDARMRIRIALAFGGFEAGMPLLGLLLGRQLARAVGGHADLLAGALLIATGIYAALSSRGGDSDDSAATAHQGTGRLMLAAAALSIDNLIVGFALGAYHVSLLLAVVIIGGVSVAMSLIGLELGQRAGARLEQHSELLGGIVLAAVGIAIAAGAL